MSILSFDISILQNHPLNNLQKYEVILHFPKLTFFIYKKIGHLPFTNKFKVVFHLQNDMRLSSICKTILDYLPFKKFEVILHIHRNLARLPLKKTKLAGRIWLLWGEMVCFVFLQWSFDLNYIWSERSASLPLGFAEGKYCPILMAFFLLSGPVSFLPEGVGLGFWNFA